MAVKSADQISIVDLTDGYSVILTSDGYTFPGSTSAAIAGSCTTQIVAMRGSEQIPAAVVLSDITKPTGITVTKDSNATSPTLTITASTSFTTAGVVTIPVLLEDGSITINKAFAVSIAFSGAAGSAGAAGADAITMTITSSAGTIFKNSSVVTTLTAHVYKAGVEVTATSLSALGTIKWYKDGSSSPLSTTGPTLTISAGNVINKATYIAQLEG